MVERIPCDQEGMGSKPDVTQLGLLIQLSLDHRDLSLQIEGPSPASKVMHARHYSVEAKLGHFAKYKTFHSLKNNQS